MCATMIGHMSEQTILIGDVHGCSRELQALLDEIGPAASGPIVFLGDLVNKGPDPVGVLRIIRSLKCISLRGNHDINHLEWREGLAEPLPETVVTRSLMPVEDYDAYLEMVASMPYFHQTADFFAVHGALRPDLPISLQPAALMSGVEKFDLSWKDHLQLDRPVVVGHKRYNAAAPAEPCVIPDRFYGIDTGCVFGGRLTALEMPSRRFWQVDSARNYSQDKLSTIP